MKPFLIDINDMTDTREMLYAKPPKVMTIFIYFIFIMIAVSFAFIYFAEIDIDVKATAIIRPKETISTVRNIIPGFIKRIYFKDGQLVKKGQPLYDIDSEQYEIELENINTLLSKYQADRDNLLILEQCMNKKKNYFKKDNVEYYNKYLVYLFQLENLNLEYYKSKRQYEINKKALQGSVSRMDLENMERSMRLAEINVKKYESENMVNIKNELQNNEKQILNLNEQSVKINNNLKFAKVLSPIHGKVQTTNKFNEGDYISTEMELIKIIPENSDELTAELIVENKDIANIKLGDSILYKFTSLPQKEYGKLKGKITSISDDIKTSGMQNGDMTYRVTGSLDSTVMYDKKGDVSHVKIGMISNVSIIVKRKRILNFLLEKLDFISS